MIIKPSTKLCTDYEAFSQLAHRSDEPIFITKDGEGDLVLMSIELYETYFSTEKQHEQYPDAQFDQKNTEERVDHMTELTLGKVLKEMYRTAPRGRQVTSIHVFSIYYARTIEQERLQKKEILKNAGLPESYQTEVSKGINLADYVDVKEEVAQHIREIQASFEGER